MGDDRVEHLSAAHLVVLVCAGQVLVQIGAFYIRFDQTSAFHLSPIEQGSL